MMTFPNLLSFLRIPLAFLFLQQNVYLRAAALFAAMATDFFDGYLARRYNMCSRVGTTLDPMTDKFFVIFALTILFFEGQINAIEVTSMLCRDFAVILFGLYLIISRTWDNYQFRAIWCGKITTALQLLVLLALTFQIPIPSETYSVFIVLGIFALGELYLFNQTIRSTLK
jgi:CDP-diacylglycerol--glycerol-3-phosphate 3-phosphatidyltransferase